MSALADREFCGEMLPLVSRTFAACIGLLPPPLGYRVAVAYLLCRIADTVEDAADLPPAAKRDLLAGFRASLDGPGAAAAPLAAAFSLRTGDEARLVAESARVLREFHAFPAEAREAIRPWVQEMCDGMAGFASMQPAPGTFHALSRVDELDRYCWYVAGTVGHLLTELFRVHSPRIRGVRYERLKDRASDFGLGLQLVNIIKDVADDRLRGWSFVPRELCASHGIAPEELLDAGRGPAAGAAMAALIGKARGHLDRALDYCLELPAFDYRIRLFCLAPLYFAVRTLSRAAADPRLLDPGHKVKISRGEVYRTLCAGYLVAPSNLLVRGYYRCLA